MSAAVSSSDMGRPAQAAIKECGLFRASEVTKDDISTSSEVDKYYRHCGHWYKLWSDAIVATENDIPDSWAVPCVGDGGSGIIQSGRCKVLPPGIDYICPAAYTEFRHNNTSDFLLNNMYIEGRVQNWPIERARKGCSSEIECPGLIMMGENTAIPRLGEEADWDGSKTFTHDPDGESMWCIKEEHRGSLVFP